MSDSGEQQKLPRRGQFQPGADPRRAVSPETKAAIRAARKARAPSTDMRSALEAVMNQKATMDVGEFEKNARKLLRISPVKFFEKYEELNKAPAGASAAAGPCPRCGYKAGESLERDAGTARALEMTEKLLKEMVSHE